MGAAMRCCAVLGRPDRALAVAGAAPGGVRRARAGLELRRACGCAEDGLAGVRGRPRRDVARAVADDAAEAGGAGAGRTRSRARPRWPGRRTPWCSTTARRCWPTTPTCPGAVGRRPGAVRRPGHRRHGPRRRRDRGLHRAGPVRARGPHGHAAGALARAGGGDGGRDRRGTRPARGSRSAPWRATRCRARWSCRRSPPRPRTPSWSPAAPGRRWSSRSLYDPWPTPLAAARAGGRAGRRPGPAGAPGGPAVRAVHRRRGAAGGDARRRRRGAGAAGGTSGERGRRRGAAAVVCGLAGARAGGHRPHPRAPARASAAAQSEPVPRAHVGAHARAAPEPGESPGGATQGGLRRPGRRPGLALGGRSSPRPSPAGVVAAAVGWRGRCCSCCRSSRSASCWATSTCAPGCCRAVVLLPAHAVAIVLAGVCALATADGARPGPGPARAGRRPVGLLGAVVDPLGGHGLRRRAAVGAARLRARPTSAGVSWWSASTRRSCSSGCPAWCSRRPPRPRACCARRSRSGRSCSSGAAGRGAVGGSVVWGHLVG